METINSSMVQLWRMKKLTKFGLKSIVKLHGQQKNKFSAFKGTHEETLKKSSVIYPIV